MVTYITDHNTIIVIIIITTLLCCCCLHNSLILTHLLKPQHLAAPALDPCRKCSAHPTPHPLILTFAMHTGAWSDDTASMPRICPCQLQRHHHQHKTRLEACSAASDMYSAGVLLAEFATGRLPFPGDEAALSHPPDRELGGEGNSGLMASISQQMADPLLVSCSCPAGALSGPSLSHLLANFVLRSSCMSSC